MYSLIRVLLLFLFLGIMLLLVTRVRRGKINLSRQKFNLIVLTFFAIYLIIGCVPVENAFVTFSSAESACNYVYGGEVLTVTEGEASACVVYRPSNADSSVFFAKKQDNGYKIYSLVGFKKIADHSFDPSVGVYHLKQVDESYVIIIDIIDKDLVLNVRDNQLNEFTVWESDHSLLKDQKMVIISAFVDYTPDYCLYVNDDLIVFDN